MSEQEMTDPRAEIVARLRQIQKRATENADFFTRFTYLDQLEKAQEWRDWATTLSEAADALDTQPGGLRELAQRWRKIAENIRHEAKVTWAGTPAAVVQLTKEAERLERCIADVESLLSVPQPASPNALPSLERKDLDAWILRAERAEQSERELLREVESLRARIDVTLGEVTMSGEQADGVSFRAAIDAAMSARQSEAPTRET